VDRVNGRIQKLEQRLHTGPGQIVIVSLTDEPAPEEAEARIQKAREQAGANGTVIIVSYDRNDGSPVGSTDGYESLLLPDEASPRIRLKWNDGPEPDGREQELS
jgi:hypothetical protein